MYFFIIKRKVKFSFMNLLYCFSVLEIIKKLHKCIFLGIYKFLIIQKFL